MIAEYISFIITFIVTAGLSVIGILTSFQLYSSQKKTIFLVLLYHQIFLISFFVYSIWGNLVLREIITDIEINPAIQTKLSIFLPVLGLPFLTVSWFMLLKFGYLFNQRKLPDLLNLAFLVLIVTFTIVFVILVQKGMISIDGNPDIFIVRMLLSANLLVHLIFAGAFFFPKRVKVILENERVGKRWFLIYFSGVILYSLFLSFFNIFGFVSTCFSIIVLFAVSVLTPVFIKFTQKGEVTETPKTTLIGFDEFCQHYEISKREAEIVMEICSGKSNKEISEKLFITLQTVKDHTHHIYSKTEVNSRIQLSNLVREKTGKMGQQSI